jgi:disulfide bond formation protein DsbB
MTPTLVELGHQMASEKVQSQFRGARALDKRSSLLLVVLGMMFHAAISLSEKIDLTNTIILILFISLLMSLFIGIYFVIRSLYTSKRMMDYPHILSTIYKHKNSDRDPSLILAEEFDRICNYNGKILNRRLRKFRYAVVPLLVSLFLMAILALLTFAVPAVNLVVL